VIHRSIAGVVRCASALFVLVVVACGKTERPKGGETAVSAPGGGGGQPAPVPGALAKPIDQYSGDELFALTRQLRFVGGVERERRCRGQADCRGPQPRASTRIRLDAVDGEDSLSTSGLPANGVVALRAINRGRIADTLYNMQPGEAHENYLIVVPVAGTTTATWRLEELTTTQGQRSHRTIASGTFKGCNHPFVRGARADFKTCAQAAASPASFGVIQDGIESPIWLGCAFGCCTADPPDGRS
jgi:hypothetical protein